MQAVALATGDQFLLRYNLSVDTRDVLSYISDLTFKWVMKENFATFDEFYGIDFAPLIGSTGVCYSFNNADPEQIFNLNR
jgi:hypothetical protein